MGSFAPSPLWGEGRSMQFLKITLPLIAVVFALCGACEAGTVVNGYIGCHRLSFPVREVASTATFTAKGPADYVAITEIYPDTAGSAEYHYSISGKGLATCERSHRGIGFGPETFFVRAKSASVGTIKLTNLGKTPVRITRVWTLTQTQLDKLLAKDSFRILGSTNAGGDDGEKLVEEIANGITPLPKYHISAGFSGEIRYANQPPDRVRAEIERCANWSKKYSLPAMIGLVSWWSGTPLGQPDGQGANFGNIKYQQVCYTPETEQPEDASLRALLGDRYDRHYCLSVPNQWSSTPWLTMNSRSLNDYRYKRMSEAAAVLKDVCKGDSKWIDNVYLENEPRYWDSQMEGGNSKRKPVQMWADFNPFTIEAAKKDGVDLNPADGLSDEELLWLFRNVGAYNQETADAAGNTLKSNGFHLPVYTHSLQHRDMFPGGSLGHPASEWAFATGARTGIEGMWSQPSDFARMREWGRWANVNREENDGRHIDEHLWDLRVAYMMGADLYNSYNWDAIGEGRFFAYVREFLESLPVVTLPAAGVKQIDASSIALESRSKLQAFTSVKLPAVVTKAVRGTARLTITDNSGRLIGMASQALDLDSGKPLPAFDFADPVQLPRQDSATARLEILDGKSRPVTDAVRITLDPATPVELSLDLRTQRALSLAVIGRANLLASHLPVR